MLFMQNLNIYYYHTLSKKTVTKGGVIVVRVNTNQFVPSLYSGRSFGKGSTDAPINLCSLFTVGEALGKVS